MSDRERKEEEGSGGKILLHTLATSPFLYLHSNHHHHFLRLTEYVTLARQLITSDCLVIVCYLVRLLH